MVLSKRSEGFFKRWKSGGGEKQLFSRYESTEQDAKKRKEMPTALRKDGLRFFFFSREGNRTSARSRRTSGAIGCSELIRANMGHMGQPMEGRLGYFSFQEAGLL